jgi:hypothetical protein
MSLPDIRYEGHGSVGLIRGHTPAGQSWLDEHVAFEHFFGGAGVVEPRYVRAIIEGAAQDGLLVEAA